MFALVDCNNFFASCEQVFNPKLKERPLVVLSNNDGCAVARSKEAKALGIPMGAPYFKYKNLFLQHDVAVFSSNFMLYGDMSHRVIETLKTFGLPIEIYSIDEAFLLVPDEDPQALEKWAEDVKEKVLKWTGIPISIGIAPTKTLAKVANRLAKKSSRGILAFKDADPYLKGFPIEDVWGIGRRLAKKLYSYSIRYAHELTECSDAWVKKHLSVVGLRTVWELQGKPCLECQDIPPLRKSIVCSRSFGKEISALGELKEAVASFVAKAARKLRQDHLEAQYLLVFIRTHRFKDNLFSDSAAVHLPLATAHTPDLIETAHQALEGIFQAGHLYKKAGILLSELSHEKASQLDLFHQDPSRKKKKKLMQTLDQINKKYHSPIVTFAGEGTGKKWKGLSKRRSPEYTTAWEDIPVIRSKPE